MFKYLLNISIFIIFWNSAFSQIEEVMITSQTGKTSAFAVVRQSNDTLINQIPLFDDFSDHRTGFKQNLWLINENVEILETGGKNIPSIGSIRFDGTRGNGTPYSNANVNGYADELTSHIVDLSMIPANQRDSTYLGFYYQKQGFGEIPDSEDSLIIEFLSPSENWINALSISGSDLTQTDTFFYQSIKIPDSLFHQKFMFRFRNYGNLSGPFDAWNIDYITLLNNEDGREGIYPDRALVSMPGQLFGQYFSMPLDHLKENIPPNTSPIGVFGKSLSSNLRVVEYGMNLLNAETGELIDSLQKPIVKDTLFSRLGQKLYYSIPEKEINTLENYLLNYEGDSLFIEGFFYSQPDDSIFYNSVDFRVNDTVSVKYPFIDYYAYDDHKPEAGSQANGSGSIIVAEYIIPKSDTLTAIDIYFLNDAGELIVPYASTDLSQNQNKRTASVILPSDGSPARYKIDPVFVEDTIYVGFQKFADFGLPVGLDKNSDNGDKIFYNLDGIWQKNREVKGSIMIRPVFGKQEIITGIKSPDNTSNKIKIYPNPSNGYIKLTESVNHWSIYNVKGQLILQNDEYKKENIIDLQNLPEGLYIFHGIDINNSPIKLKFIIQ
ncbi:T9SS type A sorting domain-containing protein [Mangrovivirga sp. M17]|uniref:T9SS type A sorting domain-containing protein n=1 Tax=Mangrovivirga halotolerans TaxID=2993936 RepID=A0ABT3RLI4_9BACT|nr:T9SS type A sorting domain-containing protein [Mangrovivirga halotolerans]MCX2742254.1 T9SS type A sorting domain-containing protein [Mangrovivirga halotolerans]